MNNGILRLNIDELDAVSGGFKVPPNYKSDNVLDARGGEVKFLGWTVTLDVNGKPSGLK